jgi:hypothetical protein
LLGRALTRAIVGVKRYAVDLEQLPAVDLEQLPAVDLEQLPVTNLVRNCPPLEPLSMEASGFFFIRKAAFLGTLPCLYLCSLSSVGLSLSFPKTLPETASLV